MEVLSCWCWSLADSHVNADVGDASMNACEFTHLSSDRKSQLGEEERRGRCGHDHEDESRLADRRVVRQSCSYRADHQVACMGKWQPACMVHAPSCLHHLAASIASTKGHSPQISRCPLMTLRVSQTLGSVGV